MSSSDSIIDIFEHFIVEYKILVWITFTISAALAFLCIIVFDFVNRPPIHYIQPKNNRAFAPNNWKYPIGSVLFDIFGGGLLQNVLNSINSPSWDGKQVGLINLILIDSTINHSSMSHLNLFNIY